MKCWFFFFISLTWFTWVESRQYHKVVSWLISLMINFFAFLLVVIRGDSWSLVVTRGHSCVLLDMIGMRWSNPRPKNGFNFTTKY